MNSKRFLSGRCNSSQFWLLTGLLPAALVFVDAIWGTHPVSAQEDWRNLYLDAHPVLDLRYRFEVVDQDDKPENANANTIRSRVGLETGRVYGIGAGFDFEWTEGLGGEHFNDTINGKTRFPVVADPDDAAINQLYLVTDGTVPDTWLKLGRQRIIWDNARFVGNVGFRQNEQTFDALRVNTTALLDTEVEYTYLEEVHRIFGKESPVGRLEMNSHAMRAQYSGLDFVTITPFALLLDFERASEAQKSSASFGTLLEGSRPLGTPWRLHYTGSFAYQKDFADNPSDFGLWYYLIEPGLSYRWMTGRLGYEVLQGNGRNAFQTPLATLHKFNGIADQFLVTPPDGLEDLYLALDFKLPDQEWLSDVKVGGAYHQYWAERGGEHYGSEWSLGAFKSFETEAGQFVLGVEYADYGADTFATDTGKLWVTLQFKIDPAPVRSYLLVKPSQ